MSQSQCFVHIALYAFFYKDKRICLKLLNKQIAARAEGVWHPFFPPVLRRSQIFCANPENTTWFEFQTETAILQEWFKTRALHTLIGFENNSEDGDCFVFNFILSNGDRSTQRDEGCKYIDHMIPADALNKLRSVTIHAYSNIIRGFSFFDKDGALLLKIGWTDPDCD